MRNKGLVFLLVVLLIGCSSNEIDSQSVNANNNQSILKIEKQIEEAKKENEFLKEKIENISADIQVLDHKSRNVMNLIKEGKLEELKNEHQVDFDLSDENMFIFKGYEDLSHFSIDLASLPMYIAYYNPKTDGMGIGYHVYGGAEGEEFKRTISFEYDTNYNLKFISAGE